MEEVTMEYEEPYFAMEVLSDRETVIKETPAVAIPDYGRLKQVVSSDRESVIKKVSTIKIPNHGLVKEFYDEVKNVIKEEDPLKASHRLVKFSDEVKNVIKEEDPLKASHLLVKFSDEVKNVIKEEDPLKASHLLVKFSDEVKNVVKEEDPLKASHHLVKFTDDVKTVFKEEDTLNAPLLLVKSLLSDIKEGSILQATGYALNNDKFSDDVKSVIKEEDTLKVSHLLVKPFPSDVKEEGILQATGYAHNNDKPASTIGNSDKMEVIVIDDSDDELLEEMVSQKKRWLTGKQIKNNFSLEQSCFLGNTLLNNAATVIRSSQFSPSRSSEYASPMEDGNYGSVENLRQTSVTTQGTSVLKSFVEIENAFRGSVKTFYYKNQNKDCKDVSALLTYLHLVIENILYNMVTLYGALKFSIIVECTYVKTVESKLQNRMFKTKYIILYYSTPLDSIVDNVIKEICQQESTCMNLDSVWTMLHISGILLRIIQFKPLRGSSYIPLPKYLLAKKCIVNPKNVHDEYCFKWAILSRYIRRNPYRVNSHYFALENKFNFKNIDFPTPLEQIECFEKNNNDSISINVYGIDKNKSVFPLRVCNEEKPEHFDLLLLSNRNGKYHYCYIRRLSRLVRSQLTKNNNRIEICRRCLTYFRPHLNKLKPHKKYCGKYIPTQITMPTVNTLKFKHFHHRFRVPIVAYASFECILKSSSPSYIPSFTTRNEFRDPASFCIYFAIDSDIPEHMRSKLPTEPYVYRGEHVAHKFMSYVTRIVDLIGIFMKDIKPLKMGKKDTIRFTSATHCDLCNCKFTKSVKRVRDYCHLTGKFRSVLCGTCNLQRQKQRFISIFIHTSSNYEFHFLIHKLGDNIRNIHINTDTSEKYISFTKTSSSGLFIRFIDVNHFLNNSLTPLSTEMPKDQFYHTGKFFTVHDMPLVAGKRVYPYEYISSEQTFEECSLPTKDNFFSKSSSKNIYDKEYEHAVQIWCHFNIKTLGEYSDLILKLDVLWLCDIFENIRTFCLSLYKIDCAYYFSVSDFAFNAMLKCTKIELELVTDNDMYILFEQGMRNGISWCVNSVSVANNQYIQETFDASKPIKFLPYLEVNDLYGWAMSKCMPYGGFLWRNPDDNLDILNVADDALVGFILEVDIEYPEHLYDEHRDLPFLLDNEYVSGQKHITLRTTHMSKKNYICHYVNLKQAVNHGLKITKIHRVLQFYQSPWLKTFIKLKAEKQQQARNTYEKLFIKLINRSVFEKCTENSRKQLNVKLVNNEKALQQHIIKPTFKDRIIFNESLCAVLSLNKIVNCNKPIYLGFTILELSKTLLYEFHYDVMKKNYGKNILLLYVDTDSIFYEVKTDDFYKDIMDLEFSQYFDISGNSPGHSYSSKKMMRKFKEKCRKTPVKEFIGERAKLYSIKTNNHDM